MRTLVAAAIVACLMSTSGLAQTNPSSDLLGLSLEELMKLEITSASRKEQRIDETPAAVSVITYDDIRRSGLSTIPELLRLIPGVQVARINSNAWAVSIRGFNAPLADKVLVLVDGRTIYNPLFAAVFWEAEDLVLEDVDRIEVIRGPGGAIWGANAANGVINIITKSAADTQGLMARIGGDARQPGDLAFRYGGKANNTSYRLFSQLSAYGDSPVAGGPVAHDSWRNATTGFRVDQAGGSANLVVDGGATWGSRNALWLDLARFPAQIPLADATTTRGAHLLGRWTRHRSTGASLQLESFADFSERNEPIGVYRRYTADFDVQYHSAIGPRNDAVMGGGVRHIIESFHGESGYTLSPNRQTDSLVNAFFQDDIALRADRRVGLSLATKFEHSTIAGSNLQPSARIMWTIAPQKQHAWAAISKAVRTPSSLDRNFSVEYPYGSDPTSGLPIVAAAYGNPDFGNETIVESEIGYRAAIGATVSVDVAGFHAHYSGLRTSEPLPPTFVLAPFPHILAAVQFQNALRADTNGVELTGRWQPIRALNVDGSYTIFGLDPHAEPGSLDPTAATYDGNAPTHQWRVHTGYAIGPATRADGSATYVGPLGQIGVPSYLRVDARLEQQLGSRLMLAISGENLFDPEHWEFGGLSANKLIVATPRSAHVQLRWTLPPRP